MTIPRGACSVAWLAALALLSAPVPALPATSRVTGTATYRERMALPPDARFEATLEDVSRADAPARVLARARIEHPSPPPIRFVIDYDRGQIVAGHSYVVRATIRDREQLLFASERGEQVLTRGHGSQVSILLRQVPREGGEVRREPVLAPLPASFVGMIPCADCVGIAMQINVLEDGAYMQRSTYLKEGHDESFYEIGTWALSSDLRTLVLKGGKEADAYWSLRDSQTLRKLDLEGREIASRLSYDLKRAAHDLPMEPRVRLRGLFRTVGDAPRFSDCLSGLQWPVARDGDYEDLENAYDRQKKNPSADLLVTLDGRIETVTRPGNRDEPILKVERFLRATPGGICLERPVQMELANTRWRPTLLAGQPVTLPSQQREPWIVLDPKSLRLSGSAGCNRVSGRYRAGSEGRLQFTQIVATKMACPAMGLEQDFLEALERTARFRIAGRQLELFDDDGALLARLEERNLQ